MALWLAICATLWHWTLATSTAYANSVDNVALLGTESQATGLIRTRWSWRTNHLCELTVLPYSDTKQISQYIALLLAIQFLHITVRSHVVVRWWIDLATKSNNWSEVTSSVFSGDRLQCDPSIQDDYVFNFLLDRLCWKIRKLGEKWKSTRLRGHFGDFI